MYWPEEMLQMLHTCRTNLCDGAQKIKACVLHCLEPPGEDTTHSTFEIVVKHVVPGRITTPAYIHLSSNTDWLRFPPIHQSSDPANDAGIYQDYCCCFGPHGGAVCEMVREPLLVQMGLLAEPSVD